MRPSFSVIKKTKKISNSFANCFRLQTYHWLLSCYSHHTQMQFPVTHWEVVVSQIGCVYPVGRKKCLPLAAMVFCFFKSWQHQLSCFVNERRCPVLQGPNRVTESTNSRRKRLLLILLLEISLKIWPLVVHFYFAVIPTLLLNNKQQDFKLLCCVVKDLVLWFWTPLIFSNCCSLWKHRYMYIDSLCSLSCPR